MMLAKMPFWDPCRYNHVTIDRSISLDGKESVIFCFAKSHKEKLMKNTTNTEPRPLLVSVLRVLLILKLTMLILVIIAFGWLINTDISPISYLCCCFFSSLKCSKEYHSTPLYAS